MKCISLNSELCIARTMLIDLNSDEHNRGLCYYSFMGFVDTCNESWNTLDGPSNRICVPNKTEDVKPNVFKMMTRINEWKTLVKHISCNCRCKSDEKNAIQIKNEMTINVNVVAKNNKLSLIQQRLYLKS